MNVVLYGVTMRFTSATEGSAWLEASGLAGVQKSILEKHLPHALVYQVPGDAGRKTAIARELSALVTAEHQELLLWVSGYGIWPSSENQDLFYGYRASLGERRSLREAPCHIVESAERVALACLLALVLYFSWDVTLVGGGGDVVLSFSHDEILTVRTKSPSVSEKFADLLGGLELKRL